MEVDKFKAALGRTIEKYAVFLDSNSIEILEKLIDSSFISLIGQAPAIRDIDRENFRGPYNLLAGQGMAAIVREYISTFCQLVEVYNLAVLEERKLVLDSGLWRNDTSPQFGSARLAAPTAR